MYWMPISIPAVFWLQDRLIPKSVQNPVLPAWAQLHTYAGRGK